MSLLLALTGGGGGGGIDASVVGTLAALTGSSTVTLSIDGAVSANLAALTGSSTATLSIDASVSATLGNLTSTVTCLLTGEGEPGVTGGFVSDSYAKQHRDIERLRKQHEEAPSIVEDVIARAFAQSVVEQVEQVDAPEQTQYDQSFSIDAAALIRGIEESIQRDIIAREAEAAYQADLAIAKARQAKNNAVAVLMLLALAEA